MKKLTPRDKYLRKKYNITEAEYNTQLKRQNGVCKICGRPPGARPLHVDHDHAVERYKIIYHRTNGKWMAHPDVPPEHSQLEFYIECKLKTEARAEAKAFLKRASVRGLICWPCNKGLQVFRDNADRFYKAGFYLNNYYDWLSGDSSRDGFVG